MPMRPCLDCGVPTVEGSRCPDCAAEREQRTTARKGSATDRGYDARWQRLSRRARRLQPWCQDCGTRGDLTADHLVWPARTLADIEVVCRPCNSRRGAQRGTQTPRRGTPARHDPGPRIQRDFRLLTSNLDSRS